MEEKKGKIIVIEGTDCSGKATQSKMLVDKLNKNGIKCVSISFPCYDTPTGRIVGGPYLGKEEICASYFDDAVNLDPKIASLYYAADRKYNIGKVWEYVNKGFPLLLLLLLLCLSIELWRSLGVCSGFGKECCRKQWGVMGVCI